ncbi:MAG TPA: transglutaminaseTgpA domain-containing protein [Candidatus Limnocylindrales bacterium]|nr:transglutaminaseTgpA domain-containing protein [Candidatus Limnocylindrales bacterium]
MIERLRARTTAAPTEGWVSLVLVALLAVTVGWSLDDAALVLGNRAWTDFLPWAALGGVLVGFVGARAGWNRPLAHLIGAAFAALIVPLLVGSILAPTGSLPARYEATAASSVNAVIDFAVRGLQVTRETGHFLLVLGLLCWANGQFAASSVFRHGRPIGPIIVLGTVLVATMSSTLNDQLGFLVIFSIAALSLLTRLHALDERATWIRRRIGDPSTVGSLYLRGGTIFIAAAVFGALTLTASARSQPLAGFWDDARPMLVDISQWLQRIIPANPNSRNVGIPTFGAQVTIGGTWSNDETPALEISRAPGDNRPFYWRATAYDQFTQFGWTSTNPTSAARPAGTDLLAGTADETPQGSARDEETFRVRPLSNLFRVAFSPIDPVRISTDATLNMTGDNGFFQSIAIDGKESYTVTADVSRLADIPGGTTLNRLRAAGTDYPADILRRYTSGWQAAMGPASKELIGDVVAKVKRAGPLTPYDLAAALETEFHSDRYHYSTNVAGVCDREISIVECFAAHKTGFCEHYATTMAILLRSQGIPARLVEGFLPGAIDVVTGKELIKTSGAHAWVEVYFPGIGWYRFDPTGNGQARPDDVPIGSVLPIPTPKPSALPSFGSSDPGRGLDDRPSGRPQGGPGATGSGGGSSNTPLLIAITISLLAAIVLISFLAWRRGPRNVTTADGFYASVAGIARRFGFGPRPTQTAFEYATALGEVLPGSRPELQTVASAKVEVAYGRRTLEDDRMRSLRDSYRRLRVALLRLAFRRRERRRMR